jgi:hypothetical protein
VNGSETAFGLIETGSVGHDLRVRDSDVEVAGGPVKHAVDRHGLRHLLVPLTPGQPSAEDRTSRGVTLAERVLIDADHHGRYLDLACELADLRDVFAVLCDDLLARLGEDPTPPAAICTAVLERWRELLVPTRSSLLGPETLIGLLTELHFMEQIAAVSPVQAVALWTGPDNARADFTGTHVGVEVKATTGRDRVIVEIHGLRQLDEGNLEDIYLYVEQLESTPAGGDSVPDALDRLLACGVDRVGLLRGLASLGYSTADAAAYRTARYSLVSYSAFRATAPGFPRLVPRALSDPTLAQRIFRVGYAIDLTDVAAVAGHLPGRHAIVERLLEDAP